MIRRFLLAGMLATLATSAYAGNVTSKATGASATVAVAHASKFQAYIDDLEANGAKVYFMGGVRRGKCWSGGMHPCGRALDVCQLKRGVVAAKCHLPSREQIATIAARHGLFEGGQWCHSDYGHAQVGVSAAACGSTTLAARHKKGKRRWHTAVRHIGTATGGPGTSMVSIH